MNIQTSPISKPKTGFHINVGCPGCGGRLELQENFFVLECRHCGSVLRVKMPDIPAAYLIAPKRDRREVRFQIDRDLREQQQPLTSSSIEYRFIYYPYWKIDAVVLKKRNKIVERVVSDGDPYAASYGIHGNGSEPTVRRDKRTEINLTPYTQTIAAGITSNSIPFSIGMRTEYLKAIPYSKENLSEDYECFPVLKCWSTVQSELEKNIGSLGKIDMPEFGTNQTRLFHPRGSLIYYPYCIAEDRANGVFRRFIADAVTGRMVHVETQDDEFEEILLGEDPQFTFGELGVDFHRCHTCGIDLPRVQSYVYVCGNCHELTMLDNNPILQQTLTTALSPEERTGTILFPFWSLQVPPTDLSRMQRMFGGIYRSDKLVIPAFKIPNFEAMFRLTKRISAAVTQLDLEPVEYLDKRFSPVTVSVQEAVTLADVIIHREEMTRDKPTEDVSADFAPQRIELFYAPFHPEHYFYVDSALGAVTFEKGLAE